MADVEEEHNSWLDTLISSFSKSDKDENKPLSISNVPLFSRPMEATDSDIPVGQDELGNVTYMTMLGDKYTVSPAPDQRTTMAKVKEDVIPAVKAYAKNPTLPTGQQVLDTGKAVAVGAYDAMSIPKKLLTSEMGASEVTVGDVLDTTGSMALGSTFAKVPQGALRTFGGSVDKDAPIGTFTTAKGSTYEHFADATTTRNRAARNDNEVAGPQPRSGKTIFMSKEAVNDWGPIFQNTEIPVQLLPLEGNKARLVYLEDYGPKKAGEAASGTFEFTTTPQLGLHPVEIAGSTNTNRRNIHFGNEIVSIGSDIEKQTAAALGRATTVAKPSRPSSAYYPIKDAPDAKVDLWKAAAWGDAAPEGLENITTNQLKEYKNLLANPAVESSQVAEWLEERFPTAFKVNSSGKMNDIGEENWASLDELSDIADTKQMADVMNTGSVLAYYRSPVVEIVEAIDYPRDGIKGSNLLKIFRDNPDIRNSEIEGMGLDIDQAKRYTKEEVVKLVDNNVFDVTVENIAGTGKHVDYRNTQRQKDIFDPKAFRSGQIKEIDYAELIVNSTRKDNNLPTHMPKEGDTHFGINNLAHARASIIEDAKGTRSVLVEELQSDLTQQGWDAPVNIKTVDEFVKYKAKESIKEISEYIRKLNASGFPIKDLTPEQKGKLDKFYEYNYERGKLDKNLDWRNDWSAHQTATNKLIEKYNLPPLTNADGVVVGLDREAFTTSLGLKENGIELGGTWSIHDIVHGTARAIQLEPGRVVNSFPDRVGAPPVKTNYETTKLSMQATLAYAARNGVGEIVIPNLERIVERRFDLGSSGYTKALDKNSGFTQTYVLSLNRYIKELQAQYPDDVKISERVLPYRKRITLSGKILEGNDTAMVIDISGLLRKNIDLTKPRFAKGGVVNTTEKQMNNLFAEGGIQDDGMNVDPVSGNEVPSGSMASEVRDDIDAKLSEGEYVVPADVVRYFGVAFFEKLRAKAKEGLSGMESDGRIGGETPEDAAQDELPFDISELQVEDTGGVDSQMADIGMADGGMVHKYVEGGFQGKNWAVPGGSMFNVPQAPMAAITYKTYVNDAGQTMSIGFDADGKPLTPIPAGYRLQEVQTPVAAVGPDSSPVAAPVAASSSNDDNGKSEADKQNDALMRSSATPTASRGLGKFKDTEGNPIFNVAADLKNPDNWIKAMKDSQADLAKGTTGQKIAGAGAGILFNPLAAIVVGGIGVGYQAAQIAEMRAGIEIAKSQGIDDATITQMQGILADTIKGAPNAVQNMVREGSGFASGTNYAKRMMEDAAALTASGGVVAAPKVSTAARASGEAVVAAEEARKARVAAAAAAVERQQAAAGQSASQVAQTEAARRASGSSSGSSRNTSASVSSASERAAAFGSTQSGGSSSNQRGSISSSQQKATQKGSADDKANVRKEDKSYGALNKGGLMTKKKK